MRGPTIAAAWLLAAGSVAGSTLALRGGESPAVARPAADTAIVSRSIAFFERRLAEDPNNMPMARQLVARYLARFATGAELRDVERADSLARILVTRDRDRGSALSRLVGVLLTQHRFAEALETASAAVALDSTDVEALGALFDAALPGGRYDQARWALARLPQGRLEATLRRAQWADARGDGRTAVKSVARVCRRLSSSARPPATIAWCLVEWAGMARNAGEPDAANTLFNDALKVLPGYRGAIEGLADLAYQAGHFRTAGQLYRRIALPAHPDLYLRLAQSLMATGDTAAAGMNETRFLMLAGDPAQEPLYGLMLASYLAASDEPADLDRAEQILRREVERRATIETLDTLHRLLRRRGRLGHAKTIQLRLAQAQTVLWGQSQARRPRT